VNSTTPTASAALGKEGPVLGVVSDLNGMKLGLLNGENGGAGKGGNGGGGGSTGANGGAGGASGNSPGQTETINVNLLGTQSAGGAKTKMTKSAAKIKIISHKVKGNVATIVLQVPAAGNVSLGAAHVTRVNRKVTKARRLTLKVKPTRAGAASLQRHNRLLWVALKASFETKSGASSSASTWVRFV
jgi:hypothetical protein